MREKINVFLMLTFISTISLNAKVEINTFETNPYACWDIADATLEAYQEASASHNRVDTREDEDNVWNNAFDNCMN